MSTYIHTSQQVVLTSNEVSECLEELDKIDWSLAIQVVEGLEKKAAWQDCKDCAANASFQLAFCYRMGFGVQQNHELSESHLQKSLKPRAKLSEEETKTRQHLGRLPLGMKYQRVQALVQDVNLSGRNAEIYLKEQRLKEAEKWYTTSILERERALGSDHSSVWAMKDAMSDILFIQGKWREAGKLLLQVKESSEHTLGLENLETAVSAANLASAYRNQGRWRDAEVLEVQILKVMKRTEGVEKSSTLTCMANLALTLKKQGRFAEAQDLEIEAVQISKRTFGGEHPETLTRMTNLATTYDVQGLYKEAEELSVEIVESSEKVLGIGDPLTLAGLANLASIYMNQGLWEKSGELLKKVVHAGKEILGDENYSVLIYISNLGCHLWNQGF